jgi:ribosomal protein S18 acetylase RimI-like enzyme
VGEPRRPTPADHADVVAVVEAWWGGRPIASLVQALFFEHFASTSWIDRDELGVRSFLIAFDSADHPDVTYIHFVGVRPDLRGRGVGAELYRRTFAEARDRGRRRVQCITGLPNRASIAFHRRMGFTSVPGDAVDDEGVPYHRDHGGPGWDQVLFERPL